MDVQANAGAGHWCIEELKFYGSDGARLAVDPSMGSAQTEHSASYEAGMAFNELTDADDNSYCSQGPSGWLQYQFATPTVVSAYQIERLNGFGNEYSPVSWTLQGSGDGNVWTTLDTQAGHSTWSDGEVKDFVLQATTFTETSTAATSTTAAETGASAAAASETSTSAGITSVIGVPTASTSATT
jgi:hypothetical protein